MATIGIFDSGSGGLSVYREIRKVLPAEKVIYYADNAWCPYGEKSAEQIRQRACEITDLLISKGADVIVVACNTATSAAIAHLRENYSIKFIGMEPAVKPAAHCTKSGVIGVLATAGTLKGAKYLSAKAKLGDSVKIVEHIGQGFVELVESGQTSGPHAEQVVRASLQPLLEAGADTIALGCTHYPFLKETISLLAGPGIEVIDPAPAVARHLLEVMDSEGITYAKNGNSSAEAVFELLSSGPAEPIQRIYDRFIEH